MTLNNELNTPEAKVIRASAGTGKTFRLSLEYIALLLKYQKLGLHFSQILVITFTKKATAEIRERIFQHLDALVNQTGKHQEIKALLLELFELNIAEQEMAQLRAVYTEMLTDKHRVQISTIDSFTNQIFKTVISPYIGLTDYTIDPTAFRDFLEEMYEAVLHPSRFEQVRRLFSRTEHKDLASYERLIKDILNKRWIFSLLPPEPSAADPKEAEALLHSFAEQFEAVYSELQPLLREKSLNGSPADVLRKNFHDAITNSRTADWPAFDRYLAEKLHNAEFLRAEADLFLKGTPFWNGNRILKGAAHEERRLTLSQRLQQAGRALGDYLYQTVFLHEQQDLLQFSRLLLEKYDDILLRERRFNYSDILHYTYQHLYDPRLSLIQGDEVSNSFYEILTTRIRFLLIDEFQDTSVIQYKLLRPIIKELCSGFGVRDYGGVIIVGDEKQSIYGWRGGERNLLLAMPRFLQPCEEITLSTSFRHAQHITSLVNTLFGHERLHEQLLQQNIVWPFQAGLTQRTEQGHIEIRLRNHAPHSGDETVTDKDDGINEFVREWLLSSIQKGVVRPEKTAILTRRNEDLYRMARALDEFKVDYVLQSSRSVFEHRAVKPLFFLFRYLTFHDITDLVAFYRSDLFLMDGRDLKTLLQAYQRYQTSGTGAAGEPAHAWLKACNDIPCVQATLNLLAGQPYFDLFSICLAAFDRFGVRQRFATDHDLKNINHFLELVSTMTYRFPNYPATLAGLLRFAEDHNQDEMAQQVALDEVNVINLMTIHKSKGLEFDSVFMFWEIAPRGSNSADALQEYLQYDEDLNSVTDFGLTYQLQEILANSSKRELYETDRRKRIVEDLNTLYVAMTRARYNLYIYGLFNKKDGLSAYLESLNKKEDLSASEMLFRTLHHRLQEMAAWVTAGNDLAVASVGVEPEIERPISPEHSAAATATELWNPERAAFLFRDPAKAEREAYIDFKSMYLKKRSTDRGNLVHYYLSMVKHGSAEEHARALQRAIQFYGTLIAPADISSLLNRVNAFLQANHADIFASRWRVFTEFTVFTSGGRELRLDRLMIDESAHTIEIIDFKTGESYDPDQMEQYISAVSELAWLKTNQYTTLGRFIEIHIQD
jgi:ATP-dependent exoDNAse (exonuclease V) beta subunit